MYRLTPVGDVPSVFFKIRVEDRLVHCGATPSHKNVNDSE